MRRIKIISFVLITTFIVLLAIFLTVNRISEIEYEKTVFGNTDADIKIEFFISSTACGFCDVAKLRINNDIIPIYGEYIFVEQFPVDLSEELKNNYELFASHGLPSIPGIAIINISHPDLTNYTTILDVTDILDIGNNTFEKAIEYHLKGNYSKDLNLEHDKNVIDTFFGKIDVSELSLPVLTIILGAMDSINPCSFFILLFLLSILLYTRSRKRMILIGSIFIFFSGFIYFIIMVLLLQAFNLTGEQVFVTILAGLIAIIFGILNIKDFFFFKKGPSASIPDSKKSKLYGQMRKIVKITSIPSLIVATIILAISANTIELLCSLNLPVIYTAVLTFSNVGISEAYLFLILYNLIYVLPLIIIAAIVVITLGRKKLSEFQGRMLKLFSGILIFSLGETLLINPGMLADLSIVILIPIFTLIVTLIIYFISKFFEKPSKAAS
jgi:hypothetical protein